MARSWLSIHVEIVEGHGESYWPRPGRILAAAPTHTFHQLASAIDGAFARWDQAHLHEFAMSDGTRLTTPYDDSDELGEALDDGEERLSRLELGEQFVYVFDLGDDWAHLCTVAMERIDPLDELGTVPLVPSPYFGWGTIPDQYGRRWRDDDGESSPPDDPELSDLPPLRSYWGISRR